MNKITTIILTCLSLFLVNNDSLAAGKEDFGPNNNQFGSFFLSICVVESNNNPKAYNKSENAIGVVQIRQKCLIDSNQYGKTKYSLQDCFNPEISKIVCFNYLARYSKKHNWEFEAMARTWNGGPNWAEKKNLTDNYWRKVSKELNRKYLAIY